MFLFSCLFKCVCFFSYGNGLLLLSLPEVFCFLLCLFGWPDLTTSMYFSG